MLQDNLRRKHRLLKDCEDHINTRLQLLRLFYSGCEFNSDNMMHAGELFTQIRENQDWQEGLKEEVKQLVKG